MKFEQYYDRELLTEISEDKDRLKDLVNRDSGFILKRFQEESIFPTKEIIKTINTAASIIFLFNNYEITNDEKIHYSKFFTDNSEVMKKLNSEIQMDKDSLVKLLKEDYSAFTDPGYLLNFNDIVKYEKDLLKYEDDNKEKRNYILASLNSLTKEDLFKVPVSLFKRFSQVFEDRYLDLFDSEDHLKIFKEINTNYPHSSFPVIKEYILKSGDVDGVNFLDERSYSPVVVMEFYKACKIVKPEITANDLFFSGCGELKKTLLETDIDRDFNVNLAIKYFTTNEKASSSVFDVGISKNYSNLPPSLKNELTAKFDSSYRVGRNLDLNEMQNIIKTNPKTTLGSFLKMSNSLENHWDDFDEFTKNKNKNKDKDKDKVKVIPNIELLTSLTKDYVNNVLTSPVSLIYPNERAFNFILNSEQSINRYFLIALNIEKGNNKNLSIDLKKEAKGLSPEIVEEIHNFIKNPGSYNENSILAKENWYGGLNNLLKDNNNKIIWTSNQIALFKNCNQKDFIMKSVKSGKANICHFYLNSEIEYAQDVSDVDSVVVSYIKHANKQKDNPYDVQRFLLKVKNNKSLREGIFGIDIESENEIVSNSLNVYVKAMDYINKNREYFFNIRNNQDRHYMENDKDKKYLELTLIEDEVYSMRKKLKKLSEKSIKSFLKTIVPKSYNEAYLCEMFLPDIEIKDELVLKGLKDKTLPLSSLPNDFYDHLDEEKLKKIWKNIDHEVRIDFLSNVCEKVTGKRIYDVISLFNFNKPKDDKEKQYKEIVLDICPEKILYSKWDFKNKFTLNIDGLYEISKAISKNRSWNFRRETNTRFAEFVDLAWENSTVKQYEDVLEKAKKEDPKSYAMLMAFSKFYSWDFEFKDNKNSRDFPFKGFQEYNQEILAKDPDKKMGAREKEIPYLEFWINKKMDVDVMAEAINSLREDFAFPMARGRDRSDYNSLDWFDSTIIEQFAVFSYADFPRKNYNYSGDAFEFKDYENEGISKLVNKLLDKDISNIHFVLQSDYLMNVMKVEELIPDLIARVDNPDDFRKLFLCSVSEEFCKDGFYMVASPSDPNYDGAKKSRDNFMIQLFEKIKDQDFNLLNYAHYVLGHSITCENSFKFKNVSGNNNYVKSLFEKNEKSLPMFNAEIGDIKQAVIKKDHLDEVLGKFVIPSTIEDNPSDYGFKL